MFLFSVKKNQKLGKSICKKSSSITFGKHIQETFSNGEMYIKIQEKISNKNIFILGSTQPSHDNLIEFLFLIRAAKENKANRINVIIPYFGYSRQDKIHNMGEGNNMKLMSDMILKAGADKIIVIDPHSHRLKKYLKNKIHVIYPEIIFGPYLSKQVKDKNNFAIVAPDNGASEKANRLAKTLGINNISVCDKNRYKKDTIKINYCSKEFQNKNCIIIDDEVSTGGTMIKCSQYLKKQGAKDIYLVFTHLTGSQKNLSNLAKGNFKKILFSDSIPVELKNKHRNLKIISIDELLIHFLN